MWHLWSMKGNVRSVLKHSGMAFAYHQPHTIISYAYLTIWQKHMIQQLQYAMMRTISKTERRPWRKQHLIAFPTVFQPHFCRFLSFVPCIFVASLFFPKRIFRVNDGSPLQSGYGAGTGTSRRVPSKEKRGFSSYEEESGAALLLLNCWEI